MLFLAEGAGEAPDSHDVWDHEPLASSGSSGSRLPGEKTGQQRGEGHTQQHACQDRQRFVQFTRENS